MEKQSYVMKDRSSEQSRPLEDIKKDRAKLVMRAQQELKVITPSLKDLVLQILEENPDLVLFLDKGARILAAPIRKYLSDNMGDSAPNVQRYNDSSLKKRFLLGEAIDEVVVEDFVPLSGKKVFYVDETFSSGKGAMALDRATRQAGVDMHYLQLLEKQEIDPICKQKLNME